MHLIFLGVIKSDALCLIGFTKYFAVDKILLTSIEIDIESLTKTGIDFMQKETTKDENDGLDSNRSY